MATPSLLSAEEPSPVNVYNIDGQCPIFLVCEHAGKRIPERLGDLGLDEHQRRRHIAWDIGAEGLSLMLSERLDAPLITQTYSRLVCDCNRAIHVESFIPLVSEATAIPGNERLRDKERQARIDEIYWPLHQRIEQEMDRRIADGRPVMFISVHSFTPVFLGAARPMHLGLLYDRDPSLAALVGSVLRADGDPLIVDNEPYALDDRRDFTVPYHGERRGIPSLEFEVRQDLIAERAGQEAWAERLAEALGRSAAHLLAEGVLG
ncbi:MAG: N-formylglutamate amidohydrolase [Geminicoccaceae bacterium]